MASRSVGLKEPRLNAAASADLPPGVVARACDVRRAFDGRGVLRGVDLDIGAGEFVALLGRSGSGKSTLLRVLAGLDGEAQGSVMVKGQVAVAFQEPRLLPWKNVLANVGLGLRAQPGEPAPLETARQALAEVGISERAEAWPLTLSGGEAQRASLARALVRGPQLLLLDEPFCALDALTRIAMHELVLRLWQRHRPTVLMVTHDVDEALALADRAVVLHDGLIATQLEITAARPRDRNHPRDPPTQGPAPSRARHKHERDNVTTSYPRIHRRSSARRGRPRRLASPVTTLILGFAATTFAATTMATTTVAGAATTGAATTGAAPVSPVNLSQVTLHLGDQAGSGSESLLKAAGLLGKLPFRASWSDFTSGPPMLQAEAAGDIDVGGVGDAPPCFRRRWGGEDRHGRSPQPRA